MNSFTFLFKAMKETHEQRKTKMVYYELKSGITNITLFRPCPHAQFFSPKNTKTYLSLQKKGTFGGLPGVALSRG
jgi:hypothetical protein